MKDNNLFISIYRNCYLRSLIRNNVFKDTIICIPSLEYLNDNHQYLSVFSNDDKLQYNIFIQYTFNNKNSYQQFSHNSNRHLVNDLEWGKHDIIDFGILYDQVHRLSFCIQQDSTISNVDKLPESTIVELNIDTQTHTRFVCSSLEKILLDLPKNLKVLKLSRLFILSSSDSKIQLPNSLVKLQYSGTGTELDRFVIDTPNKILNGPCLKVYSTQDLQWLQDKLWISDILMIQGVHQIPSHVRKIDLCVALDKELVHCLPPRLEWLNVNKIRGPKNQQHVALLLKQHLSKLRHLSLYVYIENQLGKEPLFSESLEYLYLSGGHKEIDGSMFPPKLKILNLGQYNRELKIGSLSNSITNLTLNYYDEPLTSSVLPDQLQSLCLFSFDNTIQANCLPTSLTSLQLNIFSGSFENVGTLDNLRYLKVHTLNQSMVDTLTNVNRIKLSFFNIAPNTSFITNTSITNLYLQNTSYDGSTIADGFLPSSLVRLHLDGFRIQSIDTIPPSCVYLDYNHKNLDLTLIPQSVKNIYFLEPKVLDTFIEYL
ncbi:hypothetical protein CYY_000217 [Polysphondylium violaceum]|uniref:Uncharacterized protein n=1 Tax=Polysphondylium violaceum TaxID=133409 RepID=A0A8J4V966_9MYCE|nr:hypothetical protein CYY_000217 [Polysphondylium violaceum]